MDIDLEKLEFDEEIGLSGKIQIDFFGKKIESTLCVCTDDGKIEDIQKKSYESFKEKWNQIQEDVSKNIIKYYNDEEKGSYGPDGGEEFNKWWPDINTVDELLEQITLDEVIVPYSFIMDDCNNSRVIFLTFSKKWGNDVEDNGIGVKLVNEKVKEIGFKDIAY